MKGTLHWVSQAHALAVNVRLYDRLFTDPTPDAHKEKDFMDFVNPNSLQEITAYVEPSVASASVGDRFQFQRMGYFVVDQDSSSDQKVFRKRNLSTSSAFIFGIILCC